MKKYTDKFINNFNILKNAKIGFEFEFYTSRPYYKLLELLNRELSPVKVYGYRVYHSSGEVNEKRWKIEADLSLGSSGVELVTGPLPYVDAKIYLLKILKLLQTEEFNTNEKCSLHINISFNDESDKVLANLNKLKMILNIDENYIYNLFPERENNFYAKSVKKIIPFKQYDYSSNIVDLLSTSLELPDTKYYGINFLNIYDSRLEFRYIGGENYEEKTAEILELLDYFIQSTYQSIDNLDDDDIETLKIYLSENINQFKNFQKYDYFIAEFPSINLQVDLNNNSTFVKTYYNKFYEQLYDIITNIYNLNNCIINYNTTSHKIELVDATFKTIFDIKNIDIIDCDITDGSFSNCTFINSELKNINTTKCNIRVSNIFNSKLTNSKIDESSLVIDSYIYNSYFNGIMKGGIFRSGKLGEYAQLDDKVQIVSSDDNYFNQNTNDTDKSEINISKKYKGKNKF